MSEPSRPPERPPEPRPPRTHALLFVLALVAWWGIYLILLYGTYRLVLPETVASQQDADRATIVAFLTAFPLVLTWVFLTIGLIAPKVGYRARDMFMWLIPFYGPYIFLTRLLWRWTGLPHRYWMLRPEYEAAGPVEHPTPTPIFPPGAAPPVLEVRDLFVTFQGRVGIGAGLAGKQATVARAVDGVDLQLRRGEVLALAGESGCGKTTLARTIMGLEQPQRGEIVFEGTRLGTSVRILREYRRKVQMVFQDPTASLNPRQTIYESIAEGLRVHGITEQDGMPEEKLVARALSRSGLRPPERFYLLYPHELSGGQRQRVVIAGALVLDPEIIVADEPVSSLDASVRGEILKLLLGLRDDFGIAMLVVTHDLGLAWTIADRVAVMYLGRIVEIGPAEDVLTRPLHPYTQALLEVVPEVGGLSRPFLTGDAPDPTRIPPGCRFHPRCPEVVSGGAARLGIEDRCRGEDLGLVELRPDHFAACHLSESILREGAMPAPDPGAETP